MLNSYGTEKLTETYAQETHENRRIRNSLSRTERNGSDGGDNAIAKRDLDVSLKFTLGEQYTHQLGSGNLPVP